MEGSLPDAAPMVDEAEYEYRDTPLDWILIKAMMEQWHQETHTFHLRVEEATITLQDIIVLFGLWMHGHTIISTAQIIWLDLYEELFEIRPPEAMLLESLLRFHWLRDTFHHLSDDEIVRRHARAFTLCFIDGHLFIDKSDFYVQLLYLLLLHDLDACGQ
uniref:Serine/threonine-protein phosphatase 7 long form homolog n=1 Tax=Elaeis guineensis var. tenera TaxID=51953 RepID=A0A6J0PGA2_ELAGV|nr:serine/threonine-protein phosphatase 7 long form homolog [Elaeis guineensis]